MDWTLWKENHCLRQIPGTGSEESLFSSRPNTKVWLCGARTFRILKLLLRREGLLLQLGISCTAQKQAAEDSISLVRRHSGGNVFGKEGCFGLCCIF